MKSKSLPKNCIIYFACWLCCDILGWKKVGSIEVAQTKDRMISIKKKKAMLQWVPQIYTNVDGLVVYFGSVMHASVELKNMSCLVYYINPTTIVASGQQSW